MDSLNNENISLTQLQLSTLIRRETYLEFKVVIDGTGPENVISRYINYITTYIHSNPDSILLVILDDKMINS